MFGKFFGFRSRFAIEIRETTDTSGYMRQVDLYAADRWLTCDDNDVYVPQFIGALSATVGAFLTDSSAMKIGRPYADLSVADNHLRLCEGNNDYYLAYRFMDWGPTTDNVRMHLFRENGTALLAFSFWREDHHDPAELGQVFVAELPELELARMIHDASWALMWDWTNCRKN